METALYRASLLESVNTKNYDERDLVWEALQQMFKYSAQLIEVGKVECPTCARFISTTIDLTKKLVKANKAASHYTHVKKLLRQYEALKESQKRMKTAIDNIPSHLAYKDTMKNRFEDLNLREEVLLKDMRRADEIFSSRLRA